MDVPGDYTPSLTATADRPSSTPSSVFRLVCALAVPAFEDGTLPISDSPTQLTVSNDSRVCCSPSLVDPNVALCSAPSPEGYSSPLPPRWTEPKPLKQTQTESCEPRWLRFQTPPHAQLRQNSECVTSFLENLGILIPRQRYTRYSSQSDPPLT